VLKLLPPKKVEENWETYKEHLITAFEATEGGSILTEGGSEEYLKGIYDRLMNPFTQSMHLWVEGEEDYVVLTHLQVCEFTERQTLVIFSSTRTKDVDKETLSQRYFEAYKSISKFAQDNNCVGMYCYSDLDYFAELAKTTKEWTNVITRYQFYFPLE